MKKTIIYLFAALSLFAAASCQKENQSKNSEEKSGRRVLIATFAANDNNGKATLDGMRPLWSDGDEILLTDGTHSDEDHMLGLHHRILTVREDFCDETYDAELLDGGASIRIVVPDTFEATEPVYAIYPANSYLSVKDGKVNFNIPAAVMNKEGTDYEEDPPRGRYSESHICVAKADGDILPFKNVTALIKFEGKDTSVGCIQIINESQVIAGHFSYDFSSTEITPYAYNEKSITVLNMASSGPYYIAIAPATLPAGAELVFKDRGPKKAEPITLGAKRIGSAITLERSKIYNVGYALDGVLPCAFSVSDTKKVFFSKGNLQAHIEADGHPVGWKFAEHQYDFMGNAGANSVIGASEGDVDLFTWSTSAQNSNWGINNATDGAYDYIGGSFKDWGLAFCEANSITPTSIWRTLSADEWKYLLNARNASTVNVENARYARIKVDGTSGILLFPDVFAWEPSSMGEPPKYINNPGSWGDCSNYSLDEFANIQTAGAVFLPAAQFRSDTNVFEVNEGYYWLSTPEDNDTSMSVTFTEHSVNVDARGRYYGSSVRLVSE